MGLTNSKRPSNVLKIALFATGLSGIVAEYTLSTLASYLLGNAVLQFTMIVSLMLFAMGIGSRISKSIKKNLLEALIVIEICLSIAASFSAISAFYMAAYTNVAAIFIYTLAFLIGLLIGLEIPLVTRINESYESLRENIANVMEKDYYGSLVGGLAFALVGLPILGMEYTPFVFGGINFLVAMWLFWRLRKHLIPSWRKGLAVAMMTTTLIVGGGAVFSESLIRYSEDGMYKDLVVYREQSKYQRIMMTKFHGEHWLFINNNAQLSTLDEHLYHEPLVHPVMGITGKAQDVLVLGGGDGCAVRELLKYDHIQNITLVDLDPAMTRLGAEHPVLVQLNQGALSDPKVTVLNEDGFNYLAEGNHFFDVIMVDLPDPKSVDVNKLYTKEFYQLCKRSLRAHGHLITQAGSPYFATQAFKCIDSTMQTAGFQTLPMHNQVLTLGEWGWIIGSTRYSKEQLKAKSRNLQFEGIDTRWLNNEAMLLMTSFGKDLVDVEGVEVNTISNPVLYRYYLSGNWEFY